MMETLTSITRAGASIILTYFAKPAARLLRGNPFSQATIPGERPLRSREKELLATNGHECTQMGKRRS